VGRENHNSLNIHLSVMLSLGLGLVSFGLGLERCGLVSITVSFIYQAGGNINNVSNRKLNYKRLIKYYNCCEIGKKREKYNVI